MRRVLLAPRDPFGAPRARDDGAWPGLDDVARAGAYLGELQSSPGGLDRLRELLAATSPGLDLPGLGDEAVVEQMAWRVAQGWVELREHHDPVSGEAFAGEQEEPAPPPPPPKQTRLTWIELKVVDDETGKPVSGVRLLVKLPGGHEEEHTTGPTGLVRVDEIDPGTCQVRCELKHASSHDTLGFVGMGPPSLPPGGAPPADPPRAGVYRIAKVERHKVKTGETLAALAAKAGLTWKELAKYNWKTDDPKKINACLRSWVGCRKKTRDTRNYLFDSADDPGIILIPTPWEKTGLATTQQHVIRVERVRHVFVLYDEKKHQKLPHYEYLVYGNGGHHTTGESDAAARVHVDELPWDFEIEVVGPGPNHPIYKNAEPAETPPPLEPLGPAPDAEPAVQDELDRATGGPAAVRGGDDLGIPIV